MESFPQAGHVRMNGWKEIAAYLGKSVRTAQRWETELDLPVHRIHGAGGEIIYAYPAEIEEWLTRAEGGAGKPFDSNRGEDTDPKPAGSDLTTQPSGGAVRPMRMRRPFRIALLSAVASLLLLLALAWLRGTIPLGLFANPPAQPASWKVEGGLLKVFDSSGSQLWDYNFGKPLLDESYAVGGAGFPREKSAFIADLDGDGMREMGIILRAEPGPHAPFQVVNHNGSLRFAARPMHSRQFGDSSYAAPWNAAHLLVTDEPDGTKSVWLAYSHNLWFPALLQKLGPRGEVLAEYWSNGHIISLHEGTFQGRRAILVGATNNENFAASLAVLDYANPSGSAPAANPKYRCTDCPAGGPLAFFVFPATELSRITNFRPVLHDLRPDGSGNFILNVVQAPYDTEAGGASAFYVLSSAGSITEAETGDSHRLLHFRLETRDRLRHSFGLACERQLFPVLRWDHATQRFLSESGKLANPPR